MAEIKNCTWCKKEVTDTFTQLTISEPEPAILDVTGEGLTLCGECTLQVHTCRVEIVRRKWNSISAAAS
jgi:hypothetical protein